MHIEYTVADEQRVMVGLSARETAEFERLDAQLPYDAKPVWPDTTNSPAEERWLQLFTKHQMACQAPHRQFIRLEHRVCSARSLRRGGSAVLPAHPPHLAILVHHPAGPRIP